MLPNRYKISECCNFAKLSRQQGGESMKVRVNHKKRLDLIRNYLMERGLKALAVFQHHNIIYTTGFIMDVAFGERPYAAIIPVEGEPFMILNELSTFSSKFAIEKGLCWVEDVIFYTEHPRVSNRLYTVNQWSRLFHETLAARGLKGAIGVDRKSMATSVIAPKGSLEFVDCSEFIREMRNIKFEDELDHLRRSGEVSDIGNDKFAEVIAEGKYHHEIELEVTKTLWEEAIKRYGDENYLNASGSIFGSGPYVLAPHSAPGNAGRPLQKGDIMITNSWIRINGYRIENERTWFIGEPTGDQMNAFNAMKKATEMCIEASIVGNRLADIDAAAQRVLEDAGYGEYILHRTGHGKGIGDVTDGHEYPYDMAFNMESLKPGMVLSTEPGIYIPEVGAFRFADNIVITTAEAEHITSLKYKMLENVIIRKS